MRDGNLLGRIVDTFVAAQLRPELAGGGLIGIEIKAGGAVEDADARHLSWLRDEVGERFLAGVVFHTGPRVHRLRNGMLAAPIATLWG